MVKFFSYYLPHGINQLNPKHQSIHQMLITLSHFMQILLASKYFQFLFFIVYLQNCQFIKWLIFHLSRCKISAIFILKTIEFVLFVFKSQSWAFRIWNKCVVFEKNWKLKKIFSFFLTLIFTSLFCLFFYHETFKSIFRTLPDKISLPKY